MGGNQILHVKYARNSYITGPTHINMQLVNLSD